MATSPISSSEAERAASGIRRLKAAFRNTIKDERVRNLNSLQIHIAGSINVEILQMFVKKNPKKIVLILIYCTENKFSSR